MESSSTRMPDSAPGLAAMQAPEANNLDLDFSFW